MIDQTLKYTNEIQMERRQLQEEKEELQKEIDNMRLAKEDMREEREKFYEGASWLGRQTLSVAEQAMENADNLKHEYTKKLTECGDDHFLRGRAAEWLVEKAMRITQHTKDENQRLMENALKHNPNW